MNKTSRDDELLMGCGAAKALADCLESPAAYMGLIALQQETIRVQHDAVELAKYALQKAGG